MEKYVKDQGKNNCGISVIIKDVIQEIHVYVPISNGSKLMINVTVFVKNKQVGFQVAVAHFFFIYSVKS